MESSEGNPTIKIEHQRSIGNRIIPLITSAALLMGGASNVHATGPIGDSSSQDAGHVLSLSDSELSEIQGSSLPYHVVVPQVTNGENKINSGFNTQHLGYDSKDVGYANLPEFEKQIDFISENHQTEVRFGIPRWEVASLTPDNKHVQWNEEQLEYFREASLYAQSKGLEIFFVATPPAVPEDFDFDTYLDITKEYYSRIAEEFPGVILQPGNELDKHKIGNYELYTEKISDEQLEMYRRWLEVVASAIHSANPLTQITQSLSGYPMNEQTIKDWERIAESIGENVDIFSLDTYPSDVENAEALPSLVAPFKSFVEEKGKKIVVAEVGVPTDKDVYTEEEQGDILTAAIKAYKTYEDASEAGVKVLAYQLEDEPNQKKDASFKDRIEGEFGIFRSDGSKKEGADSIIGALREENP